MKLDREGLLGFCKRINTMHLVLQSNARTWFHATMIFIYNFVRLVKSRNQATFFYSLVDLCASLRALFNCILLISASFHTTPAGS